MTDVYGDNTRAMDSSARLITELIFPETQRGRDVIGVERYGLDSGLSRDAGDERHETPRGAGTTIPAIATTATCANEVMEASDVIVTAARLRLGGALAWNDDLIGSWSVDTNYVTIVTMPSVDTSTHGKRVIDFGRNGATIVGCDASVVDAGRRVLLGVVTSDGYVHAVKLGVKVCAGLNAGDDHQISSVAFMDEKTRSKIASSSSPCTIRGVAVVGMTVCVAKDLGVTCWPTSESGTISNSEYFMLGAQAGILGNMASYLGFFGGQLSSGASSSSPLACMSSVTVDGRELLFTMHEDSMLTIWDVKSRSALYSVGLLPEAQREAFKPSCLDWSQDFVNAGGVFLISSFEDKETSATSIVALFEVTVDDRGTGALNVHVENGPQLPDVRGRVTSASIEFMTASEYRLWLVMDDAQNPVECISFKGDTRGNHTGTSYKVETMDMRLCDLLPSSDVEHEILKMFFVELDAVMHSSDGCGFSKPMWDYALNTACLPWNASRQAILHAGSAVGVHGGAAASHVVLTGHEDLDEESTASMIRNIQEWIDSSSSPVEAFERSMAFLREFIAAICRASPPRSVRVIQASALGADRLVVLARGNGRISAMADGSAEESLRLGDPSCASLAAVSKPCMGTAAMSMGRYALCRGVSIKEVLLPAITNVVMGKCHLNAVEFGKHHADVRRAFRAFSAGMASLDGNNHETMDEIVGKVVDTSSARGDLSTWTVRSFHLDRQTGGDCGHKTDLRASLAKAALEGCTRARIDLSLQLLIVARGLNNGGMVDSLVVSLDPYVFSHWACTTTVITEAGEKAEPMRMDDSSKKLKRMVHDGNQHAFDVAVWCCDDLLTYLSEREGMVSMDGLRSHVIRQFLSGSNVARPVMHAIMRSKSLENKFELLDSLLRLVECGDDASFKFFKAYSLSRKTQSSPSKDLMGKARLEQEGLGLFLSLCDVVEGDELAQCIASVTGKEMVPRLTTEGYVDAVSEILDHLGCSSSAVRAGLFSAKIQETSSAGASEASSRARTRVFKTLEDDLHMQEAYTIALSVADPQRQLDCLKSLIASLCSKRMVEVLCSLPLAALQDGSGINVLEHVTHALWERASKEPVDEATTYLILYDFFVSRGNFQSAAAALLSYARRITSESERNGLDKLLALQRILTMTVGCLKLVKECDAWLEEGTINCDIKVRKTDSFQTEYAVPTIVTVKDIEQELVLAKSLLKVVSLNPDFDVQRASHHDILVELLERGLYDSAWLLTSILPSNEVQSSKELIVFKMGKDALVTGIDGEMDAARELWTKLQSIVYDEPLAVADRLRQAIAEGILETDPGTSLPSWLMEPYMSKYDLLSSHSKPQTQWADAAGMIRLLLHYGRLEQAGILSLEMLGPLVTSLPSIAFPKVGAVCIPHDLIDAVLVSLRGAPGEEAKSLTRRLESAVRQCKASSSAQSSVLSGMSS